MDDAFLMRRFRCVGYLRHDGEFVHRQRAHRESIGQRGVFYEFEHERMDAGRLLPVRE